MTDTDFVALSVIVSRPTPTVNDHEQLRRWGLVLTQDPTGQG